MKRNRRLIGRAMLAAFVLGSVATLAACGGDASAHDDTTVADTTVAASSADTPATTGDVVAVIALDNSFRPQALEVHVGDTVSWENRGNNDHNVLSVETGEWGVEVTGFAPGAVYTHVFTEPGEYAYYCSIHGSTTAGMVGTVTVKP
jgi:plastocyanin